MIDTRREDGIAIVVALMATLMLSALGTALILSSSSEMMIAGNFRNAHEGLYAADAALERALSDLSIIPDWNALLDGSTQSTFIDGPPSGSRTLIDGQRLDLGKVRNMVNCRKATACSASDLTANRLHRPWGPNNPVWRLLAYGPLSSLLPARAIDSPFYIVVMVADDPSERDNDPLHDGTGPTSAGGGVVALRAETFGPRGTHKVVELTVARPAAGAGQAGVRVLSWRELR
jgi:hypothetical protein